MKTKYYRYTLKGKHSAEDALRKLGDAVQGTIVRIDNFGKQTQVYIASQAASAGESTSTGGKSGAAIKGEEVSEKEVTKLG